MRTVMWDSWTTTEKSNTSRADWLTDQTDWRSASIHSVQFKWRQMFVCCSLFSFHPVYHTSFCCWDPCPVWVWVEGSSSWLTVDYKAGEEDKTRMTTKTRSYSQSVVQTHLVRCLKQRLTWEQIISETSKSTEYLEITHLNDKNEPSRGFLIEMAGD